MERWEPWRALRAAGDAVELRWGDLPDERGRFERYATLDVIWLDASLSRRDRRAVLAHELIHRERGIGAPDASPATMVREEAIVRAEVVRRLVPVAALQHIADAWPDGAMPREIADHFDVPQDLAEAAMVALTHRVEGHNVAFHDDADDDACGLRGRSG